MKKWCGIKESTKLAVKSYRVVVPMSSEFIADDMMIRDKNVSGRILTKWIPDFEEAKTACMEFNALHEKYN